MLTLSQPVEFHELVWFGAQISEQSIKLQIRLSNFGVILVSLSENMYKVFLLVHPVLQRDQFVCLLSCVAWSVRARLHRSSASAALSIIEPRVCSLCNTRQSLVIRTFFPPNINLQFDKPEKTQGIFLINHICESFF